jgi:excisionase family DNA binding protein
MGQDTLSSPATVSVTEAGRILGIARNTAYAAVARGELPAVRIGRRLLVPTARLHEMLGTASEVSAAATADNSSTAHRGAVESGAA